MRKFVLRQWKDGYRKPGKVNGNAKYLENHGIHKIARQNGKNPLFDAALIRRIIQNPVYNEEDMYQYSKAMTKLYDGMNKKY